MTDTTITVQGEHSAWFPAEQATAHASVHADGSKRDAVFSRAVGASDALRTFIQSIHDAEAGPVTHWSADSVRVWSERPWNNEGKQLAPVFHAAMDFTARFRDFEVLARWVETAAGFDAVTVGSIEWDITDETRAAVTTDVRTKAVQDAVAKATVYAKALGVGAIRPLALADVGMLGDPSGGGGGPQPVFARGAMMKSQAYDSSAAQLALKPEDILIQAMVDARFSAR